MMENYFRTISRTKVFMLETISNLLKIQENDMQMLRLLGLKQERLRELDSLRKSKEALEKQERLKSDELLEVKSTIRLKEIELLETKEKIGEAEKKQEVVKKVEEFNALSQEIAQKERERNQIEHRITEENEKLSLVEEVFEKLQENVKEAQKNYDEVAKEVQEAIAQINAEGRKIKSERDGKLDSVSPEVLKIYRRLLNNKRSCVVVPIEARTCMGCHIMVTAQHENLVRRAEKIIFCEHCSRIHYLPDVSEPAEVESGKKRRRRKALT